MNLDALMHHHFEPVEQTISPQDCMLYALALGFGDDPTDPAQLRYVYEADLRVFPTMAAVIAHPGLWMKAPALEIDLTRLLHGEQRLQMHAALQPDTAYLGEYAVLGVTDKGEDKGALMHFRKQLREAAGGKLVATVTSTYFLRGDGGCGSTDYQPPDAPALSTEDAESATSTLATLPQSALLYRLCGDRNPLHADPAVAAKAGFSQPILHGLCAYGMAARGLLQACGETDETRLTRFDARFSAPVLPGDTLVTNTRRQDDAISFETVALEREQVVLKQGYACLG